jgi:V8-like Glu-specific endopeptidase
MNQGFASKWMCGAMALTLAWNIQAGPSDDQDDSGLVRVADVLDTDIRLGEDSGRGIASLDYPDATFLRVHLVARDLPDDSHIVLTDSEGREQAIDASELIDAGNSGYYAMSMDGDHLGVQVVDAAGRQIDAGYMLHVDKIDVGFRDIVEKPKSRPSAVIGTDQRERAICYRDSAPAAYRHSQAVARIYGHGYLGTGWRVGAENRMLTNHHVIGNTQNPADFEFWFGYEHANCAVDQRVSEGVKVRGGERLVGDRGMDFQLFSLDAAQFSKVAEFGHLGLDVGAVADGQVVYIPQHGAGSPRQLALFVDGGDRCRINTTAGTLARYACDTVGGSSGSPVVDGSTHKVVALHNSTGGTFNQGHRIDQIWPHIQPYFANGAVPKTSP